MVAYTAGDVHQDQATKEVQALVGPGGEQPVWAGAAVTAQVIPGSLAAELVDAGHDADLLVVGSWGSGGLGRRGLGEQPGGLDAPCPVVIIVPPLAAGQAGMRGAAGSHERGAAEG